MTKSPQPPAPIFPFILNLIFKRTSSSSLSPPGHGQDARVSLAEQQAEHVQSLAWACFSLFLSPSASQPAFLRSYYFLDSAKPSPAFILRALYPFAKEVPANVTQGPERLRNLQKNTQPASSRVWIVPVLGGVKVIGSAP